MTYTMNQWRTCIVSNNDENLITGKQAITNLLKEYFEKLLNNTQTVKRIYRYEKIIHATVQAELLELNLEEINMIISSHKNNKAPEEDNINSEFLKLAGSKPSNTNTEIDCKNMG